MCVFLISSWYDKAVWEPGLDLFWLLSHMHTHPTTPLPALLLSNTHTHTYTDVILPSWPLRKPPLYLLSVDVSAMRAWSKPPGRASVCLYCVWSHTPNWIYTLAATRTAVSANLSFVCFLLLGVGSVVPKKKNPKASCFLPFFQHDFCTNGFQLSSKNYTAGVTL